VTDAELDRLAITGVYDPAADDAAEQRALLQGMVDSGLTVDELTATPGVGGLVLRTFGQLIQPGTRLTLDELASASGVPAPTVLRLHRAWGLPDPQPGEQGFVAADVDVLRFIGDLTGLVGPELTMHFVRVLGTAMSRVAEAEVSLLRSQIEGRMESRAASVASILLRYRTILESFLPNMQSMIDAIHRAHLASIGRRYVGRAQPPSEHNVVDMVVGFADLTGSTALVRALDLVRFDRALIAFEDVTTEAIAAAGATLVKRLGDGVMFVTHESQVACTLSRRLVEAFRDEPDMPPVRVGLDAGQVAALRGDFYGPPVHLAARVVTAAPPATVLMSAAMRDRIAPDASRSVGLHTLAGFDSPVELFALVS
jgi:class 3 adenylate cyclase